MENERKKLEAKQKEYESILNSVSTGLDSDMEDSLSELSVYDNHPADIGTEMYEREKDMGTRIYVQKQMQKVEDAFESLDQGQYGICDKCSRQIPQERLEALPFTTMCVGCSEKFSENEYTHYTRPVEEDVVNVPFNAQQIDSKFSGFDGEDAWSQVAYYGTSETPADIGAENYEEMYTDQE